MNYSVQSGDNLWKIIRNKFQDLKTDTQIANMVEKVKKVNNLSGSCTIFPGQNLVLEDAEIGLAVQKGAPQESSCAQQSQREESPAMINPIRAKVFESNDGIPSNVLAEDLIQQELLAESAQEQINPQVQVEDVQPSVVEEKFSSFDKWGISVAKGVTQKALQGQVSDYSEFNDFDFVDEKTREKLRAENDGHMTKDAYLTGLSRVTKEFFDYADTNSDGILEEDEYSAYEVKTTQISYPDIDLGTIKELVGQNKTAFNLLNRNRQGVGAKGIDKNEFMTGLAYMDQDKEDNLDGKITAKGFAGDSVTFANPEMSDNLSKKFRALGKLLFNE